MTISTWTPISNSIASITNSNPGVVTTTSDHGYQDGLYVRLNITAADGMPQVNRNVYLATILSSTTFSIGIDTTNFDSFAVNSTSQVSQVIPVGEVATTLKNAERNALSPVGL